LAAEEVAGLAGRQALQLKTVQEAEAPEALLLAF